MINDIFFAFFLISGFVQQITFLCEKHMYCYTIFIYNVKCVTVKQVTVYSCYLSFYKITSIAILNEKQKLIDEIIWLQFCVTRDFFHRSFFYAKNILNVFFYITSMYYIILLTVKQEEVFTCNLSNYKLSILNCHFKWQIFHDFES